MRYVCRGDAVSELAARVTGILQEPKVGVQPCRVSFFILGVEFKMAYQALYRKYRPRTFDDVVGQEHITSILQNQISTGHTSHAYLFTGTRGTGKTTCAKILARALNCEHPVNGNPCGECFSCKGIENSSILDVVELDAASNNGVDNVRALRDEAVYSPAAVRKRVYIIDEVHMLTTQAFNALLKIMEEPPEHLVFILATTELHKVPATVLSRCQRYAFRRIGTQDIINRLAYVAEKENMQVTRGACELIARMSDGAMRDALSLLDQCATGALMIDEQYVRSAIGLSGALRTEKLLDMILAHDAAGAILLLDDFLRDGGGEVSLLDELAVLLRDVLITFIAPKNGDALVSSLHMSDVLAAFAKKASEKKLMELLMKVTAALSGMSKTSNRRTEAELCLISMCAASEGLPRGEAAEQEVYLPETAKVEKVIGGAAEKATIESCAADIPPWEEVNPAEKKTDRYTQASESIFASAKREENEKQFESAKVEDTVKQAVREETQVSSAEIAAAEGNAGVNQNSKQLWQRTLECFKRLTNEPMYYILANPMQVSGEFEGETLTVYMKNPFELQMFGAAENSEALKKAAAEAVGHVVVVKIVKDERKPVLNEEKIRKLARFGNVKFEN